MWWDLMETYKILTGLDRVDAGRMFPMVGESRTRGHSLRIQSRPFGPSSLLRHSLQSWLIVQFNSLILLSPL